MTPDTPYVTGGPISIPQPLRVEPGHDVHVHVVEQCTLLMRIRDVLICVACLCVALLTGLALYFALSVGQAIARVGDTPTVFPTEACTPAPDWPC